jgi:hypothetical protein
MPLRRFAAWEWADQAKVSPVVASILPYRAFSENIEASIAGWAAQTVGGRPVSPARRPRRPRISIAGPSSVSPAGGVQMLRRARLTVETLEGRTLLSDLAISLTTDRQMYGEGQSIHMTLKETNISKHDVFVAYGPSTDGFSVIHNGVEVWRSNEGAVPLFILLRELRPGESVTLQATWNGKQNEGHHTNPTGTFVVHNQMIAQGPTATFRIN